VLRTTALETPAWNWAAHTPQVAAFWPRRMALETAVHRWDAESAHREATGFDVDIAVDGIDEMLTVMGPSEPEPDIPPGTVLVRTTDVEASWGLRLAPGSFDVLPVAPDDADAVVEGNATSLLLALWGRIPASELTTSGDEELVAYLTS
jgi:hypothetical protein